MIKHPNQGCYAAFIGGCEGGISREHYISKCLLEDVSIFDAARSKIPLHKKLPKSALVGKILCRKHNSQLSEYDAEIHLLVQEIETLHAAFKFRLVDTWIKNPKSVAIDGLKIEKWALKTSINMIACMEGNYQAVADKLVPYIFGGKTLDFPYGLHLFDHDASNFDIACVKQNNSIKCKPLFIERGGELGGFLFVVRGFPLIVWFPWIAADEIMQARVIDDHELIGRIDGISTCWHHPETAYEAATDREAFPVLSIKFFYASRHPDPNGPTAAKDQAPTF